MLFPLQASVQQQQPPPSHGAGRASQRGGTRAEPRVGDVAAVTQQMGAMNVAGGAAGQRGPPRARHEREVGRYMEPKTRPDALVQKSGTCGQPIPLMTNYFRLKAKPDWTLYQVNIQI